jgi:hypothetical protein
MDETFEPEAGWYPPLEKLVPPDGRDHLGLVLAFPMPSRAEAHTANRMAKTFVQGAGYGEYRVLLINDTSHERQPILVPRPISDERNAPDNIFIPWLAMPTAKGHQEALQQIKDLIPQYDFIILGTGGSTNQGATGGLLELDLCEPPHFFDLTQIVDRFFFPAHIEIPEALIDRSVTYVHELPMEDHESIATVLMVDLEGSGNNSYVGFIGLDKSGAPDHRFMNATESVSPYASLKPVAVSRIDHIRSPSHAERTFGAFMGLVPESTTYASPETLFHYRRRKSDTQVGWAAGATFGVGAVIVNAIGSSFLPVDVAVFGAMMSALATPFVGMGGIILNYKWVFRKKKFSALFHENFKNGSPLAPMLEVPKTLPEIGSLSEHMTEEHSETNDALPLVHSVTTVKKIHKKSSAQYHAIRDRWLEYELDVVKFLDAPLMRDLSCDTTAQFFTAMHRSQTLIETIDDDSDFDVDLVKQFEVSVSDMNLAFERAEAFATQTGTDLLTPRKQKDFETAAQMLLIAHDEGASAAERMAALKQGRKILSKTVNTPRTIYGLIEGRINLIES